MVWRYHFEIFGDSLKDLLFVTFLRGYSIGIGVTPIGILGAFAQYRQSFVGVNYI